MRGDDVRAAIEAEVAQWPGVSVTFEGKGRGAHPKARLEFQPDQGEPLILRRAYGDQTEDPITILKVLRDMRSAMAQLGAKRREEPTAEADETAVKRYVKPNEGRAKRPDPVKAEPAEPRPSIGDKLVKVGLATHEDLAAAEQGDADAGEPALTREAQEAAWQAAADAIVDGIYFGLHEEIYHRVKRLSTSGIQRIAVSPGTFWEESWLNPTPRRLTDEQLKRREGTRIIGRAYHCARLEPDEFASRYARKPDKAEFEGVEGFLSNGDQVGAALADYGETKKRSGESVLDQARRLEDCGYDGPIWPLIEARWAEENAGLVPLSPIDFDNIAIDMGRLHKNREVAELLEGGAAEVSIFWTDRYGIPMKCRVDYLAPRHWSDFKTFDNSKGKKLRQAIADALRYNRYHIQATIYRDGVEAIRVGGLQIVGEAGEAERDLIAQIQLKPGELDCWFIFQEKSGIPNILARRFNFFAVPHNNKLWEPGASEEAIERARAAVRTKTGLYIRAIQDIDAAKREFDLYSKVYPPGEPWAPINAVGDFDDQEFNRYWLEGHYD